MSNRRQGRLHRRFPWLSRVDRRILVRVVGLGLAAFVVGYALTAALFFRGNDRPDVVAVPDLREMDRAAAARQVERLGLELVVGDSLPNPDVRLGDVLAQSPLPGREVAPGTRVRVILSAGPPSRAVPDVQALTRLPAERLLAATGFRVQVEEVPDRLPAGRVVSVYPAPGTRVQLPGVVQLRVSAGPPMVAVPALYGMREDEARTALEGAGLELGEVEYEFGGFGAQEMVVEQSPFAGDSVRAGGTVRVRIVTNRSSVQ